MAKANDVAEEVISAIRTVKSFAGEKFESSRYGISYKVDLLIVIGGENTTIKNPNLDE